MEPEQQPMEVHDPSKIPTPTNAPLPADDYGAAARASAAALAGEEQQQLEIPPAGSVATTETDKGPGEATAEKVGFVCSVLRCAALD